MTSKDRDDSAEQWERIIRAHVKNRENYAKLADALGAHLDMFTSPGHLEVIVESVFAWTADSGREILDIEYVIPRANNLPVEIQLLKDSLTVKGVEPGPGDVLDLIIDGNGVVQKIKTVAHGVIFR